jgi:hypothetical protein
MAQCCNNCFKACEPLNSCPDAFLILVPPAYPESDIILNINKSGMNARISQQLEIDYLGYVSIDLAGFPDGFFNPYGGQYELMFINPTNNKVYEFTAVDGLIYSSICFSFAPTYRNDEGINEVILNIFNDLIPDPYYV